MIEALALTLSLVMAAATLIVPYVMYHHLYSHDRRTQKRLA